jgi:hypothetical protein
VEDDHPIKGDSLVAVDKVIGMDEIEMVTVQMDTRYRMEVSEVTLWT